MSRPFDHAGARRQHADSVLVRVESSGGAVGWGEAAPRAYVTGENGQQVVEDLSRADFSSLSARIDCTSFASTIASLKDLDLPYQVVPGEHRPATAAALEGALLDAVCRMWGRSFRDAVHCAGLAWRPLAEDEPLHVSLVLDLSRGPGDVTAALTQDRPAPRLVKIKAPADPRSAVERVRRLRDLLPEGVRLVVDVNGAWTPRAALRAAPALADLGVAWVEEPTSPRAWHVLREIRARTGLGVMLDESFVGEADLEQAADHGAATHVNIRASKCGGILPAAQLAAHARKHGLRYQIGVHVGETGPLWATGRWLAAALGDAEAVEAGRQDEWFPAPLTDPPYVADRRSHTVPQLAGPGSGITPSAELLRHLRTTFTWRQHGGTLWHRHTAAAEQSRPESPRSKSPSTDSPSSATFPADQEQRYAHERQ
jgi:L-alanine-DL-glutamate epimerase-like enolase superfamily enzyme